MEEQLGFRPDRSTTTCYLVFTKFVYESFQKGAQVGVVYTDFKKAFDSVNHCILIKILVKSGLLLVVLYSFAILTLYRAWDLYFQPTKKNSSTLCAKVIFFPLI